MLSPWKCFLLLVPDTTLPRFCCHLISCCLYLLVGSSSSESLGADSVVISFLFCLFTRSLGALSGMIAFPRSTLKWIISSPDFPPQSHICLLSNSLWNILTGILNRHLSVSQTEPIFFLWLSLPQLLTVPFFLASSLILLSLSHFMCNPSGKTVGAAFRVWLLLTISLFHPCLSHPHVSLGWLLEVLTDLPDSTPRTYNWLLTQQWEGFLKNVLVLWRHVLDLQVWSLALSRHMREATGQCLTFIFLSLLPSILSKIQWEKYHQVGISKNKQKKLYIILRTRKIT